MTPAGVAIAMGPKRAMRSSNHGAAHGMVAALALVLALVLAIGGLGVAPRPAAADPPPGDAVALLPLDADKGLEVYGQPVASEIARALGAGSVAVVVVGPRMAVPERARLIIDGTIALGKAGAVTISLRIRNTQDGAVLANLAATAPGLARIDSAAAELSAHVLPIVRDRLAGLRRNDEDHGRIVEAHPAPAVDRPVLVAIAGARGASDAGPLAGALDAAVTGWTRAHHRQLRRTEPDKLTPAAIAAQGAELAIGFWVLEFAVDAAAEAGQVEMARARVRVQITHRGAVVFDRVVTTDTVLGDRGLPRAELAARVAREVLAILRPHLRRGVPSWL
jgi:hypothetical protein